jgi:hypothetical protein
MHDVRIPVPKPTSGAPDLNELLPLIAHKLRDLPDDRTSERRRRLRAQEATLRGGD